MYISSVGFKSITTNMVFDLNKDKRISFLSIFSSLTQGGILPDSVDEAVKKTIEINEELYKKYPLPEATQAPLRYEKTQEGGAESKNPNVPF